jgi:outer membrane protein TolC
MTYSIMNNKIQHIIFSYSLVFLPLINFAQSAIDTLSLDRLLQMAKQRTINSEAAAFDLQSAEMNFKLFQTNLKPQLNGIARLPNFSRTSSEIVQPDGTIRFQSISNNNSSVGLEMVQSIASTGGAVFLESNLQRFDNFNSNEKFFNGAPVRLGFFQPLFAFNDLKWDKKLEPLRLRIAEKNYEADMEQINLDAAALYFNLLVANEDLNIAISNKAGNQTLFNIAQERYKLGKISNNDLMALRLELVSATRNEQRAKQAVQFASSQLYAFLGLQYTNEMIVPITPEVNQNITVKTQFALEQAMKNRPEIDALHRMLLEADRDIAEARGTGGLRADLTASIGLARGSDQLSDIYNDPKQEQFISLSLNIPIIDWGRQKTRVALSKAQRDFTAKQVEQQQLQFETDVKQIVQRFKNLQEELRLVKELKAIAQERFEITKESYLLSAISLTELTLAQREKDQAVREYISTLGRFWSNYYQLQLITIYDFEKKQKIEY